MEKRIARQDLLTNNIAKPEGYIGELVSPALPVYVHAGSEYKITPGAATNVEDGRTPGAVVTPTVNNPTEVVFSCAERSDRQLVDDSRIATYGGPDMYLLNLAATAFISVADLEEAAIANALFALAAESFSGSTDFEKILEASDMLRGVRGQLALVGSSAKLRGLRLDEDVQDALKNTGLVPAGTDPRFVSNAALAACCGVSQVLQGMNVLWPADALAVMVLADPRWTPRQLVQSMRTIRYVPSTDPGASYYQCWQGYDPSRKGEFVDVEAFTSPKVLNASLIKIIDGSSGSSSSGA